MVEQGFDYYLCHDPANVFYLTNFANFVHERPFILLVPANGKMTFLIPKLEEPHVRVRSMGEMKFLHYFEFPAPKGQQWSDRLQEVLLPNHCVGVESLCPLSVFQAVPGSPVASDIVDEVRMVKFRVRDRPNRLHQPVGQRGACPVTHRGATRPHDHRFLR